MRPNPTGRLRFAPEPPIHNPATADPFDVHNWLDRQFRALGDAIDQTDQLDVATEPPPANESRVGMIRYLEDTPLGYGPGPYCYTCLETSLAPPDDTLCFWQPMFNPRLNVSETHASDQALAIPALTWTQIAELTIIIRLGNRVVVSALCNGGTTGRTDINLAYRLVINGVPSDIPPFGFDHIFSNVNVDQFYQTHGLNLISDPQLSALSESYTIGLEAYTDVDIGAVVDDWEFSLQEQ